MSQTTETMVEEMIASQDDGTWVMADVSTSSLWKDSLGPGWETRVEAEYFRYFWDPIVSKLTEGEVQQLKLTCKYIFGVQSDPEIREYMKKTSSPGTLVDVNPQMLVVSHQVDDQVIFCHMEVIEVAVAPLSMEGL